MHRFFDAGLYIPGKCDILSESIFETGFSGKAFCRKMDDSSDGGFRLSDRLAPERSSVLEKADKTQMSEALLELPAPFFGFRGKAGLAGAVRVREKLLNTGIGQKSAVPHVRLPSPSTWPPGLRGYRKTPPAISAQALPFQFFSEK